MQQPNKQLSTQLKDKPKPWGFFVIEGIEGSGKSTLIDSLSSLFKNHDIHSIVTREPGGTKLGTKLREILLENSSLNICSLSELLIFYSDRAQHISEILSPALENKKLILCDRFIYSTIAYQNFGRGLEREIVDQLNQLVVKEMEPHGVILLDIDPEISLLRAKNRGKLDRFELENLEFHKKVRDGYLKLSEENPDKFLLLDATLPEEELVGLASEFIVKKSYA